MVENCFSEHFAQGETSNHGGEGNVGKHNLDNKKSYKFQINGGKPYEWPEPIINETDIRRLGQIPEDEEILMDIPGEWRDFLIKRGEDVDLSKPGIDKFITRKNGHVQEVTIYVNSTPVIYDQSIITFEKVASLAYGKAYDPSRGYSIAYSNGPSQNVEGLMCKGKDLYVTNGMQFDVAVSHQS